MKSEVSGMKLPNGIAVSGGTQEKSPRSAGRNKKMAPDLTATQGENATVARFLA